MENSIDKKPNIKIEKTANLIIAPIFEWGRISYRKTWVRFAPQNCLPRPKKDNQQNRTDIIKNLLNSSDF